MNHRNFIIAGSAACAILAACSSGSPVEGSPSTPSPTLSGTAATGAPIAGSVVAIDANGKVSSAVGTNPVTGMFVVDVAGLTAPFLLQVAGTSGGRQVFLSSVAIAPGQTVNITPLTDLIVSAAAGSAGGLALVDACATASGKVSTACTDALKAASDTTRLAAAVKQVSDMIVPLNPAGANPLTGSFSANGQGMDAVLDKILVTPATSSLPQATVTLIASHTTIGQMDLPTTSGDAVQFTLATPPLTVAQLQQADAAAQVLPQIKACLASFTALYPASNFTPPSQAQVAPFIDDSFMGFGYNKQSFVELLTSGDHIAVAGFTLGAAGLATYNLDPLSATEVANLVNGTKAVLRARPNNGAPIIYDANGNPSAAWVGPQVNGNGAESPWKFIKGDSYPGCEGGWRLAGPLRPDMHMDPRISRDGSIITRSRAVHLETDDADKLSAFKGVGTIDQVIIRGPGLALYSGDPAAPVGASQKVTLSRPSGLETSYFLGGWYGNREALQSCSEVAVAGAPAGTPCVDESQVVPGAVYSWVLKSAGQAVFAFPYQVTAVPLSRAFVQANQDNLFATVTSLTPVSVADIRTTVAASSGSVLDDLFTIRYTQGSAYGSRADSCGLRLYDASSNLLLAFEVNAMGHENACTFTSSSVNSGSLAKPANPAAISAASAWVTTRGLGNSLSTSVRWP